ncbi:hypothetical protein L3Q72_09480 [Vibrio sp. JC009]|uniref:hypothetical protein n=1 Tax=Vibrio sp. JC009 TaxID=2912314 RepID=UPI0023B0D43F|nr:hypothetical protein [Vibrio sp. JC009]WED20874.1 hypothetical protein L3Q72_09480 [Vibrio sp. JC009]
MSSTNIKSSPNKAAAVSRAQTIAWAISNSPVDTKLTEKARKAARKFRHKKSAISGCRVSKSELRAANKASAA